MSTSAFKSSPGRWQRGAVLDVYDAFEWVGVVFGRPFWEEEGEGEEDSKEEEEKGGSVIPDLNEPLVIDNDDARRNRSLFLFDVFTGTVVPARPRAPCPPQIPRPPRSVDVAFPSPLLRLSPL